MKLSIIIPVFNEEKTLELLLNKVFQVKLPQHINKEIIVIDDGSDDSTGKILVKHKKKIKISKHKKNLGKGAAIRTGLELATGDFLIIQDADLEYNPQDYLRLLIPMISKKHLVVYGTRLKNYPLVLRGKNKTPIPTHWLGNKFLTLLTNILYGSSITDMETGYKLFRKEVIEQINLKSNRFEIEPEITAKILKKGHFIKEIPIKVSPRTHQEGKKISWRDGISAAVALIKYRFVD